MLWQICVTRVHSRPRACSGPRHFRRFSQPRIVGGPRRLVGNAEPFSTLSTVGKWTDAREALDLALMSCAQSSFARLSLNTGA